MSPSCRELQKLCKEVMCMENPCMEQDVIMPPDAATIGLAR